MNDGTASDTAGLARYVKPELSAFRPSLIEDWKAEFADSVLAEEILLNPRLEKRVAEDICRKFNQPLELVSGVDTDKRTIAALMDLGEKTLTELAGCVWYRYTVLDWMTWNNLDKNLPGVNVGLVRTCLRKVSPELAKNVGAPTKVIEGLTYDVLCSAGADCLSAWFAQSPPTTAQRLALFMEPSRQGGEGKGAELIRAIATLLVGDAE